MISADAVSAFAKTALSPDPDLAVAALMIARVEYPKLDAGPYLDQLDALGREARRRVEEAVPRSSATPPHIDPEGYARVMALNDYLFGELRFVGNDVQYEDPRNSFLNEVLDRRTGIPITLSLVYMEVARRAGVRVEGVNFPGHFLIRWPAALNGLGARVVHDPAFGPQDLIIDAHHRGALLSEDACRELLRRHVGDDATLDDRVFARAAKPQILTRMCLNLKRLYVRMHSFPQAKDVTELLLALNPSAIDELRDRGLLAYHLKDFSGALRDLQEYLRLSPTTDEESREEQSQIWEHVKTLRRRVASLN